MIPLLVRLVVFFSSFLPSQLRAEREREKLSHVFFSTQSKRGKFQMFLRELSVLTVL